MSALLFTKDDVNKARKSELIRLLRVISYRLGIRNTTFSKQHFDWCMRVGYDKNKTQQFFQNHRGMICANENMTIKTFFLFIKEWMNLSVVRLSITLLNPDTGQEMTFHSDDIVDESDVGSHSAENTPDVDTAIDFIVRNATSCKSAEEKQWLIDQVLKSLAKDKYEDAIGLSPDSWERGKPPKTT